MKIAAAVCDLNKNDDNNCTVPIVSVVQTKARNLTCITLTASIFPVVLIADTDPPHDIPLNVYWLSPLLQHELYPELASPIPKASHTRTWATFTHCTSCKLAMYGILKTTTVHWSQTSSKELLHVCLPEQKERWECVYGLHRVTPKVLRLSALTWCTAVLHLSLISNLKEC